MAAKARVWWRPRDGDKAIASEMRVNTIGLIIRLGNCNTLSS